MSDLGPYDLILSSPHPLYMGRLPASYAEINATVFINLCGHLPDRPPVHSTVLMHTLVDSLDLDLQPRQEVLESFLASVHTLTSTASSYWHCYAGLNRSGIALAAYLHLYRNYKIGDAIALLRRKRSELVLCNSHFEGMLRKWYGTKQEQRFEGTPEKAYYKHRNG